MFHTIAPRDSNTTGLAGALAVCTLASTRSDSDVCDLQGTLESTNIL